MQPCARASGSVADSARLLHLLGLVMAACRARLTGWPTEKPHQHAPSLPAFLVFHCRVTPFLVAPTTHAKPGGSL